MGRGRGRGEERETQYSTPGDEVSRLWYKVDRSPGSGGRGWVGGGGEERRGGLNTVLRETRFRDYGTKWIGHLGWGWGEGGGGGGEGRTQYSALGDGALRPWYTEDRSLGMGDGGRRRGEERGTQYSALGDEVSRLWYKVDRSPGMGMGGGGRGRGRGEG